LTKINSFYFNFYIELTLIIKELGIKKASKERKKI
jgi:hypothetical protein